MCHIEADKWLPAAGRAANQQRSSQFHTHDDTEFGESTKLLTFHLTYFFLSPFILSSAFSRLSLLDADV